MSINYKINFLSFQRTRKGINYIIKKSPIKKKRYLSLWNIN